MISIIERTNTPHFTTNKYPTENPYSMYLGSIKLSDDTNYDLYIWQSVDNRNTSLVFLMNEDYTNYHSVPFIMNNKTMGQEEHWLQYESVTSVIHLEILRLAREKKLLC